MAAVVYSNGNFLYEDMFVGCSLSVLEYPKGRGSKPFLRMTCKTKIVGRVVSCIGKVDWIGSKSNRITCVKLVLTSHEFGTLYTEYVEGVEISLLKEGISLRLPVITI